MDLAISSDLLHAPPPGLYACAVALLRRDLAMLVYGGCDSQCCAGQCAFDIVQMPGIGFASGRAG